MMVVNDKAETILYTVMQCNAVFQMQPTHDACKEETP